MSKRLTGNVLLLLASIAFTLAFLEAGIRIVTALDSNYLDDLINYQPVTGDKDLLLVDFIRPVEDDLLVYTLRPGAEGRFQGADIVINNLAMRGRARSTEKETGTFRIVGLGDSHMFGWGVGEGDTFLARLEEMLNQGRDGSRFEVFNLAVPGYNTVQEVRTFALRADELDPDMVIINYVGNDMDLPNFLTHRPNLLSLRKSYFWELVKRRYVIFRGEYLLPVNLTGVVPEEGSGRYRMEEDRVPERFKPLYGRKNMVAAYGRLARLARQRGIPYVILFNADDYRARLAGRTTSVLSWETRELADYCRKLDYIIVDPQDRIAGYLEKNGLGSTAVWVSRSDSHSNPLRHSFVAEELLDRLREENLLPSSDYRP